MNRDLSLPGNPRYRPRPLVPYFGYDNLYRWYVRVELAALDVLIEIGIIPANEAALLTKKVRKDCLLINTTEVDREENIVKHDVVALKNILKRRLPTQLHRWIHIPMTSYDVIDTARVLMVKKAHQEVIRPTIKRLLFLFCEKIEKYSDTIQIGRTHGQHAVPITVGFWLATIASRIEECYQETNRCARELCGKISGPVGAYNAQYASGIIKACGTHDFEDKVLSKLGLSKARISTQINPPEKMARYLNSMILLSGALAQFGRDCRHLMRTEIDEIREAFDSNQSGSSTMAHKRNPLNFENIEGTFIKNKAEYFKVLDTLISEHQRDLVNSPVVRDFPIIIINTFLQLNTLLKEDKKTGKTFFERISINQESCQNNLKGLGNVIMAEPFYIALQMAGYDNAHDLVNHHLTDVIKANGKTFYEAAMDFCDEREDTALLRALQSLNKETKNMLATPLEYCGLAKEKAINITERIKYTLENEQPW